MQQIKKKTFLKVSKYHYSTYTVQYKNKTWLIVDRT